MVKNSHKQKSSACIVIIVILIIVLLGALGFAFWQNFSSKSEPGSNPAKIASDDSAQEASRPTPYALSNAVRDINATLKESVCSGNAQVKEDDFIQVKDTDGFEYQGGKTIIDQQFNYAYVQYGCGSQGGVALMKRVQTDWKIVSEDARIYPMCEAIEGESFPSAIVDKCYDTTVSTEPRNIVSS